MGPPWTPVYRRGNSRGDFGTGLSSCGPAEAVQDLNFGLTPEPVPLCLLTAWLSGPRGTQCHHLPEAPVICSGPPRQPRSSTTFDFSLRAGTQCVHRRGRLGERELRPAFSSRICPPPAGTPPASLWPLSLSLLNCQMEALSVLQGRLMSAQAANAPEGSGPAPGT